HYRKVPFTREIEKEYAVINPSIIPTFFPALRIFDHILKRDNTCLLSLK
ncbi:13892_t:CDS:1, partial [Funneliformis mosseae]